MIPNIYPLCFLTLTILVNTQDIAEGIDPIAVDPTTVNPLP